MQQIYIQYLLTSSENSWINYLNKRSLLAFVSQSTFCRCHLYACVCAYLVHTILNIILFYSSDFIFLDFVQLAHIHSSIYSVGFVNLNRIWEWKTKENEQKWSERIDTHTHKYNLLNKLRWMRFGSFDQSLNA